MNTYSEVNYKFYRTNITFTESDTLQMEKKTVLSYTKEIIPLIAFSPEYKIIKKKLSTLARFFFMLEFTAIVGFFVTLFRDPAYFSGINLPLTFICILAFLLISWFYYFSQTKSRVYFYYWNDRPAFVLSHRKNNHEQKEWISKFNRIIKNARVSYDQKNFIKMRKGIDSLLQQNLISKEFSEELLYRVDALANSNIK